LVVNSCICGVKLVAYTKKISLECVVVRLGANNLTQMFMETLMKQGGLTKDMIGKKLMTFHAIGVFVFQGVRSGVTKQIFDGWDLHSMGKYCMVHKTNLAIQTLSHLPMVNKIEGLLFTF